MPLMFVTLLVLKLLKSISTSSEQLSNIPSIVVTLLVSKLLNVMLVNALKLLNKFELLTGA